MTELGEALELMHTSIRRWRTLRAEGLEWKHTARQKRASERWIEQLRRGGGGVTTIGHGGEPPPEPPESEERWRLWLEPPDRARSEFTIEGETVTVVWVGDTWWSRSPAGEVTTNAGDPQRSHGTGPGQALIDPAPLLRVTELEVAGLGTFLGRPVIRVAATPSPIDEDDEESDDWRDAPHGLGHGAEDYHLLVDAERGVLLRSEARIGDEPFRRLEMAAVAFDENFPEGIFRPPEGKEALQLEGSRSVSLADLPSAVPFTVLVPERPPFGPPHASIEPPDRGTGIPLQVYIDYSSPVHGEEERQYWLIESAEPIPDRPWAEWHKEGDSRFGLDRMVDPPVRLVQVKRSGTYVEIQSYHLGKDELIELARSLVPLPGSPPPVLPSER